MRFKGIKFGKDKTGSDDEEIIEVDKLSAEQISEMEEQINSKTKGLEDARQKLKGLSESLSSEAEDRDAPRPHGPISELTVEPEDRMLDIDLDMPAGSDEPEESSEEIQLVEVNELPALEKQETAAEEAGSAPETPAKEPAPKDEIAKPDSDDDSFSNLFSDDEEEANPLAALISSLPDVTAQELVDDLQEIKDIILDNKHSD